MENNITTLFKALNYMNKKTLIPAFDDFIFIEDGKFVLQDAFKTYTLSLDILSEVNGYAVSKAELLKIKTKNTKYFIDSIANDTLYVKLVSKDSERTTQLPLIKRCVNILPLVEEEFKCSNLIETNGINLKAILNGCKDVISFKTENNCTYIAMGEGSDFVSFNDEFGELCLFNVINDVNSEGKTCGQNIVDTISQFGLVKKNSTLHISFNEKCFIFNNNNIKIYFTTNK